MDRSNEGKACDAVIRHIEAREGSARQNLQSPERERDSAPIELTCSIAGIQKLQDGRKSDGITVHSVIAEFGKGAE